MIQIGIRGTTNDPDMWGFSTRSGMRVLPMEEFHDKGWRYAAEEARRVAGSGPTYLTFDIDSLDPSQAPGTGTPEAGGITALEALRLLRALRGIDFVGGDLVEVAPPFDVGTITSFNGASVLFEILCLLAEAWQKRHALSYRARRRMAAPAAIAAAPPQPRRPGRSPRNSRASTRPSRMPVSRSAATGATGAWVIAHSTSA